MKILLLEDNVSLAEIIKEMFEEKGLIVDWFKDGEEALYAIINGYDCFVLDINVPSLSGLNLLKEIRDRDKTTPAIIISSNIELETIQKAYVNGCNDFLKKPFYIYELECKVDLLCKNEKNINLCEGFSYNLKDEILYDKENNSVKLTHKEKRLLTLLCKTPNITVSLEVIEQYVWEGEIVGISGIRSLIKRVRLKICKEFIQTENYGYKLITNQMGS
ncbi:DNA-binding response regulator [Halarcobacter ebronensis]|uniref:DNA-binding response regulator n=1 Tax=Halarcobacter ebronensis TaxID=1462615 RepID=A0A4Q0Y8V7_9BACT|nr:response regulator transcription factor [Halarcobacter ebronensis]RXJ66667.1 DNA-binding response regulator [Halarcobacter ebronensis]